MSHQNRPFDLPEEDSPTTVIPDKADIPLPAKLGVEDLPTTPEPLIPQGRKPNPTGKLKSPFSADSLLIPPLPPDDLDSEITDYTPGGPDLSSEQTMLHGDMRLVPIAFLFVETGPNAPHTYSIFEDHTTFGREDQNSIQHNDLSVSREHFVLTHKRGRFTLTDLGSSSGTIINNNTQKGSTRLKNGDKIQVGQTLLVFKLPPGEVDKTDHPIVPIVTGLVVVLLLALSGIYFSSQNNTHNVAKTNEQTPPDAGQAPVDPTLARAKRAFQQGLTLAQKHKWLQAQTTFETVAKLAKKGSILSLEAAQLAKAMQLEQSISVLLVRAETHLKNGQIDEAQQLILKAEKKLETSNFQAEDIWSVSFRIKLQRDGKSILSELKRAEELRKQKKWNDAIAILLRLQRIVVIGSNYAKRTISMLNDIRGNQQKEEEKQQQRRRNYLQQLPFRKQLTRAKKLVASETYEEAQTLLESLLSKRINQRIKTEAETLQKQVKAKLKEKKEKEKKVVRIRYSQGTLLFNRGQLSAAATAYINEKKPDKAKLVIAFQQAISLGRSEYALRNPTLALPALLKAYQIDQRLSEGKSTYSKAIKFMLSNMFYARGRRHMSDRNYQGYSTAFLNFQQTLRYHKQHVGAKRELYALLILAKGWLKRAQKIGKSKRARRLLRAAQSVVRKRNPLYKQITNELHNMSQ